MLPHPPTSFVGREDEIATIHRLLDQTRLLTITGPGGVGKTRLALQAVGSAPADVRTSTYYVDLSALQEPALVLTQIALALGVRDGGELPLTERIGALVRERFGLIVLDNCEHVIGAASDLAALLAAVPSLRVIATSRTPWRIRGEHELPIGPLPLPEPGRFTALAAAQTSAAVTLFVARAQAVRPEFTLTPHNAATIAAICTRLDGLPLAIELAAARLRMLNPVTLLERLEARLPLLTGGPRDAPARQRTLRDTIAWSVDLLEPEDRLLFARLAVFSGGCTFDAIVQVCGTPETEVLLLDSVTILVEQSLLQTREVAGATRYSMLETVREYATELLAATGEEPTLRRCLADALCTLAEEAEPALLDVAPHEWYAQLEAERENIRQALIWAAEHGDDLTTLRIGAAIWRFWWACGGSREGLAQLQAALARADRHDLAPALRIRALNAAGNLAWTLADYATALTAHQDALAQCEREQDDSGVARHTYNLGIVAEYQGDDAQAEARFTTSLRLYRELHVPYGIGLSLRGLAAVALLRGDTRQALALANDAVAVLRSIPDRFFLVWGLNQLGATLLANNQPEAAAQVGREAALMMGAIDGQVLLVDALLIVACAAVALGDPERGTQLFAAAETLRARQHWSLSPKTYALIVPYVRTVRTMVNSTAFHAAWRAGEGLSAAAALELAFEAPQAAVLPAEHALLPTPPAKLLPAPIEPLTPRELEVLALIVEGLTNKGIAERLLMSVHTVHSHVRTIFSKLGVSSRAAATRAAIEFGLVNQ